jgi:heat shock protein HslJ
MKIKLYLLLAFTLLASACGTTKKTASSQVDDRINNIVWSVISFKGHTLSESNFTNGLPRISFNMQDGKISGTDGCNSFMGLATYKDNTIKTGPIASTKMACPGNNIQDDFYTVLSSGKLTWQLDNTQTLRLMSDGMEMMALRERE